MNCRNITVHSDHKCDLDLTFACLFLIILGEINPMQFLPISSLAQRDYIIYIFPHSCFIFGHITNMYCHLCVILNVKSRAHSIFKVSLLQIIVHCKRNDCRLKQQCAKAIFVWKSLKIAEVELKQRLIKFRHSILAQFLIPGTDKNSGEFRVAYCFLWLDIPQNVTSLLIEMFHSSLTTLDRPLATKCLQTKARMRENHVCMAEFVFKRN